MLLRNYNYKHRMIAIDATVRRNPMIRTILTIVLLASVIHLSAEEFSSPQSKEKPFGISSEDISSPPLPADVLDALRNAPAITLLSLDPTLGKQLSDSNTFHGWRVLGQTEITVADDCKTVATAIETAVNTSKGVGALCFVPHHGIVIKSAGQTYEFVICFMCGGMYIYTSGQESRFSNVAGKGEVLDKLLAAAKIPLGKTLK